MSCFILYYAEYHYVECHYSKFRYADCSGALCTADVLINIGCFVEEKNVISVRKAANPNWLVPGGQLYVFFHFSKDSVGIIFTSRDLFG